MLATLGNVVIYLAAVNVKIAYPVKVDVERKIAVSVRMTDNVEKGVRIAVRGGTVPIFQPLPRQLADRTPSDYFAVTVRIIFNVQRKFVKLVRFLVIKVFFAFNIGIII